MAEKAAFYDFETKSHVVRERTPQEQSEVNKGRIVRPDPNEQGRKDLRNRPDNTPVTVGDLKAAGLL